MITSSINVHENFGAVDAAVDEITKRALNAAAAAGSAAAEQQAGNVADWKAIPAHGTATGFASGIKADTPLWRVYDKGSLGKRTARLKQDRRKPEWQVNRGTNPYTARRRSTSTGGVAGRNISNPARTAGRKALKAALTR
jgi:hypothetical protein